MTDPTIPPAAADDEIDYRRHLLAIWRRRWLALGVCLTVFALVFFHALRRPKIYAGTTSMIIDSSEPQVLPDQKKDQVFDNGAGSYWYNAEYYKTQYQVIQSRAVAERAVEQLGLEDDPEFLGIAKIKDPEKRAEAKRKADPAAILQAKITLHPVKDSRLVKITVDDTDPKRAALLSNAVADAYIAETLALKSKLTESASQWLEDRLDGLSQKSKKSELAVYQFKKDADMLTTSLEDKSSMIRQQLTTYNGALTDVRTKIAGLEAQVAAIHELRAKARKNPSRAWAALLPIADGDPVVSKLQLAYVDQQGKCAALTERYLSHYPKVIDCEKKLAAARTALENTLDQRAAAAQTALVEATTREHNLERLYEKAKADAFALNKHQIEYQHLEHESQDNQRLYESVLGRLKEIELSGMLRTTNARVLDRAKPSPIPVRPRLSLAAALGLLLGVLGGAGVAVGLELLDDSVSTQKQVEELLDVPFLGLVPSFIGEKASELAERDLAVHRHPHSALAESFRTIRTNLLFMSPDHTPKVVLVTSAGPREGKSTSSIHLAVTLAQSGNRVLLLDTDLRKPRLHKAFGVANGQGISSVVVGDVAFDEGLKTTEIPNLFVMPSGRIPPNPAELLQSKSFGALLARATEKFDRVVLDSPPINVVTDAAVLATQVDGVVVVVKAGKTKRAQAQWAVRGLDAVKAKIYGALLNDVDLKDPKYRSYALYRGYGYDVEEKPTPG